MSENKSSLVVVESPAKVKTLGKILKGNYEIKASYGHIRDLPRSSFGLDVERDFLPTYKIISGRSRKIVKELKKIAGKSDRIILATDPDREGEAIAWHIAEELKLPPDRVDRITFNEITPSAVLSGFKNPRKIDMNLVNAQQCRRFLDRIVGYNLSPLLWKKIAQGLSAGRVQSVAVKLLVDREKEIASFKPREYWKINAEFHPVKDIRKWKLEAPLYKINDLRFGSPAEPGVDIFISGEAEVLKLRSALESTEFRISRITEKESEQSPPPPFITSTLQQQASIQLGFSTKKTMSIAQQLYEGVEIAGEPVALITYMRTDAVRVSETAVKECRSFIAKKYGDDFLNKTARYYKSRKTAQAAHEAIRPTYMEKTPEEITDDLTADQYKLYDLIWKRFIATQMKPARWLNKTLSIERTLPSDVSIKVERLTKEEQDISEMIKVQQCTFRAEGKRLLSKGYLVLYSPPEETHLPGVTEKEPVKLAKLMADQNLTQPPARYSEATLVKTMEKYGIGRPSTYAPIISTIQERGYVRKNGRQLVPTELGILVTEKLIPYFQDIINTKFTSELEKELDRIEEKKVDWVTILKDFYKRFRVDLEKAATGMEKEKGKISENGEQCSKCGKPMVERWGRYGKFLACSGYPECKNIISIKSKEEPNIPPQTCEKCGKPMVIKMNKRGMRFLACSSYPDCKNTKSLKMAQGTPG